MTSKSVLKRMAHQCGWHDKCQEIESLAFSACRDILDGNTIKTIGKLAQIESLSRLIRESILDNGQPGENELPNDKQ